MASKHNSYKQLERFVSGCLIFNVLLFIAFLFSAGFGVTWLTVILTIITIFISILCLYVLYASRELMKPRSLWMTVASVCLIVCVLASLLLGYPSPAP